MWGILFSRCPSVCSSAHVSDPILLKFIWYLTIYRIQVEFEKAGYASILPGVMVPDRHENFHIFGFRSIT